MTKFTINGRAVTVDVPGDVPLLWVIREELRLSGTKFGCGMGLCGACTIHLNGNAVRSCVTPVSAAEGQNLTTIEGLSKNGDHPLQQAWKKHNVVQCGYCQPGQIMNAAALLQQNPHPSAGAVDAAMTGNICRCGTYQRIRAAILDAAAQMQKP